MRLKPDCIRPSSLPSNTGTSASKSPSSTRFSASRTETTGSAMPRAACQVINSPMASDTPPRHRAVIASWVSFTLKSRQRRDGHQHEPEQRHAGAQRPRGQRAGHDAGGHPPLRGPVGQRAGHHRPQQPFADQVTDRARGHAAQRHHDAHHQRQARREGDVHRGEHHHRQRPQQAVHHQDPPRRAQRQPLLVLVGRAVGAQPGAHPASAAGSPTRCPRTRRRPGTRRRR